MALYMLLAKYTPEAVKAIVDSDESREDAVRKTVEAAGGELLGFYGLIGQDHHVAVICNMPGVGEYIGTVLAATMSGSIESFKTVPMYNMQEMDTAKAMCRSLTTVYKPPS